MAKKKITIGEIQDKLESIYLAGNIPVSPQIHADGMRFVIKEILIALGSEYVDSKEAKS